MPWLICLWALDSFDISYASALVKNLWVPFYAYLLKKKEGRHKMDSSRWNRQDISVRFHGKKIPFFLSLFSDYGWEREWIPTQEPCLPFLTGWRLGSDLLSVAQLLRARVLNVCLFISAPVCHLGSKCETTFQLFFFLFSSSSWLAFLVHLHKRWIYMSKRYVPYLL